MQPEPKKHVSHAIAWSLIALFAGSLAFGIWMYSNQIDTIYTGSTTISVTHKKTAATKPTTATSGTTVTDTTADWQIYTNATYGFSFKYPKDWLTYQEDKTNGSVKVASTATINNINVYNAQKHTEAEITAYMMTQDMVNVSYGRMNCTGTDSNLTCVNSADVADYLKSFTGTTSFDSSKVENFLTSGNLKGYLYDAKKVGNQEFNEKVIAFQSSNRVTVITMISDYTTTEITTAEDQHLQDIARTFQFTK